MTSANSDKLFADLRTIAAALRDGKIRSQDIAAACCARHNQHGADLQAYRSWDESRLKRNAALADSAFSMNIDLGPLQGIPFSVKDLYGVAGYPTYAGSPKQLPAAWSQPGTVIRALTSQLAPISGKTHTVEFAYGGLGTNAHWGTPRNPWDSTFHRVPGGSSAGAGVSLIEGSALFALGTDTAGSVRIPASMTGNVGFKPTLGRWPTDGIVPLSPSFDTPGIIARSVSDAAFVFAAIDQHITGSQIEWIPVNLEDVKLGIPPDFFWDDCSPGVGETVRKAIGELDGQGVRTVALEVGETHEAYEIFRGGALAPPEVYAFLRHTLPEWIETLDPSVSSRIVAGQELPAWEYLRRRNRLEEMAQSVKKQLEQVDALVVPTVAISPPKVDDLSTSEQYSKANLLALRNTSIVNLLHLCAITIPVGLDAQGLPVGLQMICGPDREIELLQLALSVEKALGHRVQRLGRAPYEQ